MSDDYLGYNMDGDLIDRRIEVIKRLEHRIARMRDKELEELLYRESHPAVQDAYEQYQTVLRLSREADA